MTEERETKKGISRRQFLGGTIGGLIVGAAAGAAAGSFGFPTTVTKTTTTTTTETTTAKPWLPTKWDYDADVVVIGYGGAGAVSALEAYKVGAKVIILEKTPSLSTLGITPGNAVQTQISGGGGSTHIDGGLVVYPTDPVAGAQHLYALSFGSTPMDVCQAWGTMANQNKAYIDALGLKATLVSQSGEFPALPGWSSISNYNVQGGGATLFLALDKQVQAASPGIQVLFGTKGTDLIQNGNTKEILGVKALQVDSNTVINIQAKKATIICTGGFEYDDVYKVRFSKAFPEHFYSWQYNTGEGIRMGQKAGGALWHMNAVSGRPEPWVPRINQGWSYHNPTNNYIWVNRYGDRFLNESGYPSHSGWCAMNGFNLKLGEYSNLPSFVIFDETYRTKGPVASGGPNSVPVQLGGVMAAGSEKGTPWSSDNSYEISQGWIMSGSDLPTLASNIQNWKVPNSNQGMATPPGWHSADSMDSVTIPTGTNAANFDQAKLQAAVTQFNTDCTAGKGDTVFGRTAATMAPVQTPPFYALPLWVGGPNTQGGLERNALAQIVDPDRNPIPRLYGAGEMGSVYGFLYPTGGGNNCELIAFGRIAGSNAAKETSWV